MPRFEYRARSRADGSLVVGVMEGESPVEVARALHQKRFIPLEIRKPSTLSKLKTLVRWTAALNIRIHLGTRRPGSRAVSHLIRQWGALLAAGVPLRGALALLVQTTDDRTLRQAVADVLKQVEGGAGVAQALLQHPELFPPHVVGLVQAGEAGGELEGVLSRLSKDLEQARKLKRKVIGALLYPALVLVSALGATALLMVLVVPTFAELYASAGLSLPLPTRFVLGAAGWIQSGWYVLTAATAALFAGGSLAMRTERGKRFRDRVILSLPLAGPLVRAWTMARFTRVLGALLGSGVGILEALGLARETMVNRLLEDAIRDAAIRVRRGESLEHGLRETGAFSPLVLQMVQVGEETGGLSEMLDGLATLLEDETEASVQQMLGLLEPVLVLGVGVLVGGLILALYLPILDLAGTVG